MSHRMLTLHRLGYACCLWLLTMLPAKAQSPACYLAQGCMAGEVTATSVLLQTRLTTVPDLADLLADIPAANGFVCFEWSLQPDLKEAQRSPWLRADPQLDSIVRTEVRQLQPHSLYYYRALYGLTTAAPQAGPVCRFRTLPSPESTHPVRFTMGSCMNYNKFMYGLPAKASGPITATESDKKLGFPAFEAMKQIEPDFFIGTGDIVYYDNIFNGPARMLPELRQCWHEQFRFPRLIEFFQQTPAYWSKDDHDFRFDDSDLAGSRLPLPQTGIDLFREQMPILPMADRQAPTYRTHRIHRHLQLWFTEGRDFRSPNKMPDGPDKSLWGVQQRDWLQRSLLASDATWKILVSPTPMVGPDDASKQDNHTNLGGFRHEAETFFDWLRSHQIRNFVAFCGDRHWQYHSRHPRGIQEFACGALNDENARLGVAPRSPKGTDPEGLIEQPFLCQEPTGGFLDVTAGEHLLIRIRDDHGQILYEVDLIPAT
jgi:alkaline phosphatase D